MYTTFHFASAEDADNRLLDAIKAAFKSKPITITVQEDTEEIHLTDDMKKTIDERLNEDTATYISGEVSVKSLRDKYGL